MIVWSLLGGVLALLWLLDGLRLRGRARALSTLTASDEPVAQNHVFLTRPGVVLDDATRRAASAYARDNGLEVLDLVSPHVSTWRALVFLQWVDPEHYRTDRVALGATAGDAILVDSALLERVRGMPPKLDDVVAFAEAARVLKRYATTEGDLAIAPGLVSPGVPLRQRRRLLRKHYTDLVLPVVGAQLALLFLVIAFSPVWGLAALAALNVQALLITVGTPFAPRDVLLSLIARVVVDALSTFGPAIADAPSEAPSPDLRPTYEKLLAGGVTHFFDPPRQDCPICASRALTQRLEVGDRYQFKPGRFVLARCNDCGHIFQNPRLSIQGLSFYYRDFYDGLYGEKLEGIFASSPSIYRERAQMVADVAHPKRWLDVGAGHGHFCCIAREVLPETHFDGLDLSESIDDAVRRRWVERGLRGLFPEMAVELAKNGESYDVVSMSHYLEHTLDPRAEIAAASHVLPNGGLLFIEVPDPDSRLGWLLGRQWMPWFQPQHLHFVSARNLERLLKEHAFEPLMWHRGRAHQAVDFTFLAYMCIELLARPIDLPWRPPSGLAHRLWRQIVWTAGVPLLVIGWIVDRVAGPLIRRGDGWSNTYRVLARRAA